MTVAQAIAQLSQEDPAAEMVMIPRGLKNETIDQIKYWGKYFWRIEEVAGKDSSCHLRRPFVVLLGERSDE